MKTNVLTFCVLMMLLNGCVISYHPAIRGTHVPPIVKSHTQDVQKRFSSFDVNSGATYEPSDRNLIFRYRSMRVVSTRHADLNIGYQVYGGQYSVASLQDYKGDYLLYGGGLEAKGYGYFSVYSLDIGIGFHLQQVVEFGEYLEFRKDSNELPYVENSTSFLVPTMISLSPMFRYNLSETSSIALQTAVGMPQLLSPVIMYQNDSFISWINYSPVHYKYPTFSIGFGIWK